MLDSFTSTRISLASSVSLLYEEYNAGCGFSYSLRANMGFTGISLFSSGTLYWTKTWQGVLSDFFLADTSHVSLLGFLLSIPLLLYIRHSRNFLADMAFWGFFSFIKWSFCGYTQKARGLILYFYCVKAFIARGGSARKSELGISHRRMW